MRLTVGTDGVHIDWADPSLLLTGAQREAMRFDREVVVTAGAGAGKTHTLSLRYVHLLLQLAQRGMPDIESVLVLTFTEKAAAEMAERCYRRLLSLADAIRAQRPQLDAHGGPDNLAMGAHLTLAIDRLRDSFERARIGTFHSFCAAILREFPAETGVGTRTTVADNIEASQATDRALDRALQQLFRERPDDLPLLLDALGSRHSLMSAGRTALHRRGVLFETLRAHSRGEVDLATWLAEAPLTPREARRFVDETARPTLEMMSRVAAPAGGPWIVELKATLQRLAAPRPPGQGAMEVALAAYDDYRAALACVLTRERRLRRFDHHTVIGRKASWPDLRRYKRARAAMQVLQDRCSDWQERAEISRRLPVTADRDLLIALGAFGRWVLDADGHLNRIFADNRQIDFADMQIRAVRAVLEHSQVRDALRSRFRYLMVDEFQDTDELQWALVRALGRGEGPNDRIFLVGDAKQAIYGFRGGDVTIFRQATAAMGTTPVLLADNFRSRPELIDWFNAVFPHILAPPNDDVAPWEAPYEALRAGRVEAGGSVSAILGDADDEHWESEACARLIAAELLTDHLQDLLAHPTPPIAILLRRRTHLQHYEAALRRFGVPFVVAQGVGFWTRPEVVDLVNTLHALATGTPASIVGMLRSPLFCLTDQDIFDLNDLAAFGRVDLADRIPERVRRAESRYRELLALRYRIGVSELTRILADLAAGAWYLERGAAALQARANANRLVELARSFEDRSADGLLEASEAFLALVLAEARESEAVIAPTEARVVVMTVHAAKGLEFPVVLIPELNARTRPDNDPLAVARLSDGRWRIATSVVDSAADVQRRTRPGLLNALRDVRRNEQYAEYRRLFYVAATRARDHLILVGESPRETDDPPRQPSWAEILLAVLPPSTRVRSRREIEGLPVPALPKAPPIPAARATPQISADESVQLSASALDLHASCPARWYRRHFLGIPETTFRAKELARTLAAARGQVIHSILEDDAVDDEALIRTRWLGRALAEGCTRDEAEALLPKLLEHTRRTRADPHLQRALDATGRSEVPFSVAAGPVVLRGQIDRLYRDASGWVVLDYKSEAVVGSPADAAERHRSQLLAYGWAADRVLRANGKGGVVAGEVYFTALGASHRLGPWQPSDLAAVEGLLEQVADTSRRPWAEVESRAITEPRPCDSCGFSGRGCRGNQPGAEPRAE